MKEMKFKNATCDREYKVSVLVVDDEAFSRESAVMLCENNFKGVDSADLRLDQASSREEALEKASSNIYHLILLDRDLGVDHEGKKVNGISLIKDFRHFQPFAEIIMLTGHEELPSVVQALNEGASNYLTKSNSDEDIAFKNTVIRKSLSAAKERLNQARTSRGNNGQEMHIEYKSPAMQQMRARLEALAESNRPVLLIGAPGLGKTVHAKVLNQYRASYLGVGKRPFFNLNIAAMSDSLTQSELFGHEANAFTGAGDKAKLGYFELANGGDLFLDEIGDASIELQSKLLKVIEEREFQRIGGNRTLKTTARVILATNKDLPTLVREGRFKPDLYARISTFEIQVPSLSERKEDMPDIIRTLLERAQGELPDRRLSFESLPTDFVEHLCRPDIPNNIRGIENDLQRVFLFAPKLPSGEVNPSGWKKILGLDAGLPRIKQSRNTFTLSDLKSGSTNFLTEDFPGLKKAVAVFENAVIQEAFRRHETPAESAKALKIARATLWRLTKNSEKFNETEVQGGNF